MRPKPTVESPPGGADEKTSIRLACILLSAAGVTLRQLTEERTGEARVPSLSNVEEVAVLRGPERARVKRLVAERFLEKETEKMEKRGVKVLHPFCDEYPAALRQIPDAPLALYTAGITDWLHRPAIAIVGSREASLYGRMMAESLAGQLVLHGLTVVSGFARGVDSAAHRGAVRSGGGTVAVLGCGVDVNYPSGNEDLRKEVEARGCLICEFPMGREPGKQQFPRRNRIISGLSLGVIVVEAIEKSGALITARHAMEQGREVFAVPGSVFSPSSFGPHRLIKDGARMVESAEDVLQELEGQFSPELMAAPGEVAVEGTIEARVLAGLKQDPVHVDELSRRLAIPIPQLMPLLSLLELKRLARQHPGKFFSRA